MTAETLRKAAALMRERAEPLVEMAARDDGSARYVKAQSSRHGGGSVFRDHFTPWDTDTAAAIADWLEAEAKWADVGAQNSPMPEAVAVATTYLAATPPTA